MKIVLLLAALIALIGILIRFRKLMNLPEYPLYARQRGNTDAGVRYAFGLGLAPWSKESTRIHMFAYIRGIVFHLAIASSFIVLLITLFMPLQSLHPVWLYILGIITGLGALAGLTGLIERFTRTNLRYLSLPDDYIAVFLVTGFVSLAAFLCFNAGYLSLFYGWTALMLIYIPFSKITHFLYWFYTRYFFGYRFGHRGVLPHPIKMNGGI